MIQYDCWVLDGFGVQAILAIDTNNLLADLKYVYFLLSCPIPRLLGHLLRHTMSNDKSNLGQDCDH